MDCQKKGLKSRSKFMNNFLDDIFHPDKPICQIIRTNGRKKQDYFELCRPRPHTCLDYNISQTDAKMDAGDTKIHIQETKATYIPNKSEVPPPPPLNKRKYFSGGPPQWEFLEEIWQREEEERQKIYNIEFKKRVKKRKEKENRHMSFEHNRTIAFAGPEWYQELSPNQFATVDNLKNCLLKDLSEGTIINTKENIGALGLVPRPNHRHIEKALKNCFKCPVEFLLILYQLIDPKRKQYSINDRLLLSAVVHLTMKDTLKEMHIRIPSPPPPPKIMKKVPKKKKKAKYKSPYLEPFTFKREPPKFTGIYFDKHIQRPQSPYFSYLCELKDMKEQETSVKYGSGSPVAETIDKEIEEELRLAQIIYEELVDFRPVPLLLRPSKYFPCNFKVKPNAPKTEGTVKKNEEDILEVAKPVDQVRDAETEITVELSEAGNDHSENTQNILESEHIEEEICFQNTVEGVKSEKDKDLEQIQCQNELTSGFEECMQKNIYQNENNLCYDEDAEKTDLCYITKTKSENVCPCGNMYQKNENVSAICTPLSKESSEYMSKKCEKTNLTLSTTVSASDLQGRKCNHSEELEIYNKMYHVIRPSRDQKKKCECKEKYREMIESPLCQCEKCLEERKTRSINYVISGLTETGSKEAISIIDRVVTQKPCDCLKKYETKIKEYEKEREKEARRPCGCLKQIQKLIETPFCQCTNCQEDRKIKAAKYVISGIKETETNHLRIIDRISLGKPCECVKKYKKRIDEYETFQKRKEVVVKLKEQEQKFVIGGTVNTLEGPVYVISGMRPPVDCSCAKKAREEIAEKHMQAIMPHVPPGRVKYEIAGVKETPEGNVYIMSNAMPIGDCECMKLYEIFAKQHSTCNNLYEEYLTKMKEEYDEFLKEMLSYTGQQLSEENTSSETEKFHSAEEAQFPEENIDNVAPEINEKKSQICESTPITCESCKQISKAERNSIYCDCEFLHSLTCSCGKIQHNEQCTHCSCGDQVIECVDCTCGPVEHENVIVEKKEKLLKRFFIFKKILCEQKWQMEVIKQALQSLAEDGYPLAKLPECYKLPHFRLWMLMRCRMFWAKQNPYDYILKSKGLWTHCDICDKWRMVHAELNLSKSEAALLDWSKADYCRKLINECLDRFYRRIKQNRIHLGREFFPTTFPYYFPVKTWRDCNFAYIPNKEEEVHARFVWKKFEYKNFADMKRFCR